MHVSLTDKLEEYVKARVNTGLYNNASEVIREALRIMQKNEDLTDLKLQGLKDAIRFGDESKLSTRSVDDIIATLDPK